MEPGTFVLHLPQPSISPTTMAQKRRKLDYSKPLPIEPSAPGRDPAGNNSSQPAGPPPHAESTNPAHEASAPAAEEVLVVLVGEPRLQLGQGTLSTSSKLESFLATNMKLKE